MGYKPPRGTACRICKYADEGSCGYALTYLMLMERIKEESNLEKIRAAAHEQALDTIAEKSGNRELNLMSKVGCDDGEARLDLSPRHQRRALEELLRDSKASKGTSLMAQAQQLREGMRLLGFTDAVSDTPSPTRRHNTVVEGGLTPSELRTPMIHPSATHRRLSQWESEVLSDNAALGYEAARFFGDSPQSISSPALHSPAFPPSRISPFPSSPRGAGGGGGSRSSITNAEAGEGDADRSAGEQEAPGQPQEEAGASHAGQPTEAQLQLLDSTTSVEAACDPPIRRAKSLLISDLTVRTGSAVEGTAKWLAHEWAYNEEGCLGQRVEEQRDLFTRAQNAQDSGREDGGGPDQSPSAADEPARRADGEARVKLAERTKELLNANMLSQHVVDGVEPSHPHIRRWIQRNATTPEALAESKHLTLSTTVGVIRKIQHSKLLQARVRDVLHEAAGRMGRDRSDGSSSRVEVPSNAGSSRARSSDTKSDAGAPAAQDDGEARGPGLSVEESPAGDLEFTPIRFHEQPLDDVVERRDIMAQLSDESMPLARLDKKVREIFCDFDATDDGKLGRIELDTGLADYGYSEVERDVIFHLVSARPMSTLATDMCARPTCPCPCPCPCLLLALGLRLSSLSLCLAACPNLRGRVPTDGRRIDGQNKLPVLLPLRLAAE